MVVNSCEPCVGCNPDQFARGVDTYRQAVLHILCDILAASGGGGGGGGVLFYDYEVLVDPITGVPVLVRSAYNSSTGAIIGITAFNLDGTAYVGAIADLQTNKGAVAPSVGNSTAIALGIAGVFTGAWELNPEEDVLLAVRTDQNGSIALQFSPDGINIDSTITYPVTANITEVHRLVKGYRYFRAVFTNNSGVAQTFLRLSISYGQFGPLTSSLNSNTSIQADAIVIRDPYSGIEAAQGNVRGITTISKFGRNSDIDTGSLPEDVWEGGGLYTGQPIGTTEVVQAFSSSALDTAAGTGARTIRIYGLRSTTSVVESSEDIILSGVTPVASLLTWYRIYRMQVLTAGTLASNQGVITVRHTPTIANVFISSAIDRNQSSVAAFTLPVGVTGYIQRISIGMARNGGESSGTSTASLRVREVGSVYQARRVYEINTPSNVVSIYATPLKVLEGSDIIIRIDRVSDNNTIMTAEFEMIMIQN